MYATEESILGTSAGTKELRFASEDTLPVSQAQARKLSVVPIEERRWSRVTAINSVAAGLIQSVRSETVEGIPETVDYSVELRSCNGSNHSRTIEVWKIGTAHVEGPKPEVDFIFGQMKCRGAKRPGALLLIYKSPPGERVSVMETKTITERAMHVAAAELK
ncbi:hypothetical protein C8R44DRAFT_733346 [Mycena epipterygia]|nr:hypothetical protein C8R44DRAFT_733346 [Mycena epipterygia]